MLATMTGVSPVGLLLCAALLLGGGAILRREWCRRVGGEPRCGRCDYNLTGLESERCPECGAQLASIRVVHGRRQRRPAMIIVGCMLLLLCASPFVAALWDVDWYQYRPTGWVLSDLNGGGQALRDKAWDELMRREQAGKLADRHMRRLVGLCLAEQAKPAGATLYWPPMDFLGSCYERGRLTAAERDCFLRQMSVATLRVRPRVVRGQLIPFEVNIQLRTPLENWGECEFDAVWVDGDEQDVELAPTWVSKAYVSCRGSSVASGDVGTKTLRVDCRTRLIDGALSGNETESPCYEDTVMLEAEFDVVEGPVGTLIRVISDPELAKALSDGVTWSVTVSDSGEKTFELEMGAPPVALAFDVLVREGDQEVLIGRTCMRPHKYPLRRRFFTKEVDEEPRLSASNCTIVLRGSRAAAAETLDVYEYWDGELVFEDVPVEYEK